MNTDLMLYTKILKDIHENLGQVVPSMALRYLNQIEQECCRCAVLNKMYGERYKRLMVGTSPRVGSKAQSPLVCL